MGVVAGVDGGGSGGSGDNKDSRDGKPNTGGGGGGGTMALPAGKGGDGVVIIRLSNYIAGGVVLPKIPDITYDGKSHTPFPDTAYYTVSGDVTKTDAGTSYKVTLTLTELGRELGWDDPTDPRISGNTATLTWSIKKRKVPQPELTAASFTYNGQPQTGYKTSADYTFSNTGTKVNTATAAGTYTPTATLVEDGKNLEWADGKPVTRTDLSWTIAKRKIDPPARTAETFTYTGEEQQGYVTSADYTFSDTGKQVNRATNAGTYTPTATLVDATNTEWRDGTPSLSWTIDQLTVNRPVAKTGLVFTGEEQVAYEPSAAEQIAFTLTGHTATDAGSYTFTATFNNPEGASNYKWRNGDDQPLPVAWSIAAREVVWPPAGAKKSYDYEKGVTHTPIPDSPWYTKNGPGSAEEADDYVCIVTPTHNDGDKENVVFRLEDGTTTVEKQVYEWSITAQVVPIPTVEEFTYAENPKDKPVERTALTITPDDAYELDESRSDPLTQKWAGKYAFVLKLKDEKNTVWSDGTHDPQEINWSIEQAANELKNLKLDDWQVNDETTREAKCEPVFGPETEVKYAWGTSETGAAWTPWSWAARPKEAGTYYLKAETEEKPNWLATNAVKRFCVWVNPADMFTDFADITLTGLAAGDDRTVDIRVREAVKDASGAVTAGLPGFEFARTGLNGGEIRFVLTNAVKSLDRLLPFKIVGNWAAGGESTIRVKIGKVTAAPTVIRMYWHAKAEGVTGSDNHPEDVLDVTSSATAAFSLVNREGRWIDYWTTMPSMTQKDWSKGGETPKEEDFQKGALKLGDVTRIDLTMPLGTTNTTGQLPTEAGSYAAVFARSPFDATYTLFQGEQRINYDIVWHNTYTNLGGSAGGRILLGNSDTKPGHEITGQCYWETDPSQTATYWVHEDSQSVPLAFPYFNKGVYHALYSVEGRVLWRVRESRLGSYCPRNKAMDAKRNYLPWSDTSVAASKKGVAISFEESSQFILRNLGGYTYAGTPAIYSPCYTNGIGTIYFDAVNGFTDDLNAKLIIEIATETSKKEAPTDENCVNSDVTDDPYYFLTHDAQLQVLSEVEDMWKPITREQITVFKKTAASNVFAVDDTQTFANDQISLAINKDGTAGGTDKSFYRIAARVNFIGPVRLRIRRPVPSDTGAADTFNHILIDNVIVSPPAMGANLAALGTSDEESERTGKQTLGQAGALTTAFPAMTDTGVKGRAVITYSVAPGIDCDKKTFVASARFNYRWRYLKQDIGEWQALALDATSLTGEDGEVLETVRPIDFTGRQGDIEWYYDMTLQAPAYDYVDYSGDGVEKPVADYSEELRSVTNRLVKTVPVIASAGDDWFVRLREGQSDWEGMEVVITNLEDSAKPILDNARKRRPTGPLFPMELVGDNMWRAMVVVPTNANGKCSFTFRGVNLHENGNPDAIAVKSRTFGTGAGTVEIPTSGQLTEGGVGGVTIELDHVAGYLEFRLSDKFLTWQIGRAEYQDFNAWNDAHTPTAPKYRPYFRADSQDTNSVNVADMSLVPADIASWTPFTPTNAWWLEDFYLPDYNPPKGDPYEKNVFHTIHATPRGWTAQNITFVSEQFVTTADQSKKSGLAGKLLGGGSGLIDFTGASTATAGLERPAGLEKVTLSARLGQSISLDSFAYDASRLQDENYYFFVPVTMSHKTQDSDSLPDDMAVGASVSAVGYCFPKLGCYEFRAERLEKGDSNAPKIRLSIYKWYYLGEGASASELLCWRDFTAPAWTYEWDKTKSAWNAERDRGYFGLMISLETEFADDPFDEEPVSTRLIVALSEKKTLPQPGLTPVPKPWKNFDGATFRGLVYEDRDDPFGWGAFGVGAKDCPAQFVMPAHKDEPFDGTITENANPKDDKDKSGSGGKWFEQALTIGDDFTDDRKDILSKRKWTGFEGRYECFTNTATGSDTWLGIRAPTNAVQTLELYLKPKGKDESQWALAGTKQVSGYGLKKLDDFNLRRTGAWDVRLKTGAASPADVVVDNIVQWRWQAPDYNDPDTIRSYGGGDTWLFSQGLVELNAKKEKVVTLQPARAQADRPVSMRGPIMGGLGKFTFSYTGADANAEVWVQVATNLVSGTTLTGDNGYNNSILSKDLGEQQEIGEWLTVARYSATAEDENLRLRTGASDSKSLYLGWHNHADRPIKGLFRLFVPPATVEKAVAEAEKEGGTVDWGRITVTAASCTDEPGLSPRSWRGWNMRTIGDATDSESRMNLVDMVIEGGGQGLVAALNNSTKEVENNKGDDVDEDDLKLRSLAPAIYSPTMQQPAGSTRGVGSVTVKARLYSTNGVPETSGAGRLVVWGARDSRAEKWIPLATNAVTSSVFSNFTWTAGREVYTAIKLEVSDPSARTPDGATDRIVLDEIVIGEKVPPTIGFVYARPFRMDLFSDQPIADILSPAEQPLAGESWGVQTKLTLQQLTDEIDVEKGFEVYLSYFRGLEPWGYGHWKDDPKAVKKIRLLQVGEATNLVFRSIGDTPESLVGPSDKVGEIVQFMLTVKYWDRGGKDDTIQLTEWRQPDWFYPLDYNKKNGADEDPTGDSFAAYTALDTVSPGRAWINEVSWNDGPSGENGGTLPTDNQYVELCIPAGIDMSGWKLRVTDFNENRKVLARLGDETADVPIPGSKMPTANCTNGYEFLVLKSPGSKVPEADASWYAVDIGDNVTGGTLNYGNPYQFELIRPSGIIEHQMVIDGTNRWSSYGSFNIYDGTNLVHLLDVSDWLEFPYTPSPKRFYAGHELSRTPDRSARASIGVVGGEDGEDTSFWPGGSNTWAEGMSLTPGRINAGQVIPKDWFIAPNGTNSWVYFTIEGGHVRQNVGGETNRTVLVVLPQGQKTNAFYAVDNWYEATVLENGVPRTSGRTGSFDWQVSPTGMYYVTVTDAPQRLLEERFGLDALNPYTSAVFSWLKSKYGDYGAEDIRLARFKGLQNWDKEDFLSLTDMYWLDIPPVPETPEERAHNDGTNWWFRGGITKMGTDHVITRRSGDRTITYTNKQVEVMLYVSNEVKQAVWAPQKLQGLANESSADYSGSWTSVTFKICGKLDLEQAKEFLPFRTFTFNPGSFTDANGRDPVTGAETGKPFTSVIDILDPFQSPAGEAYGWDKYPNTKAYFMWMINTEYYPYTIEKLKADSTYQSTPEP